MPHVSNGAASRSLRKKLCHQLAVATLAAVAAVSPAVAADEPPREAAPALNVLFLGDQGHHNPGARFGQFEPVMSGRGIRVVYTEDLAELNPENLSRFDCLLIYANIDHIGPPEEKALVDYVAGGGGLAPIHCASYCFHNSPEYIALVGAQFQRHGTGTFDTNVVDAEHAITKGLAPFTTWDETYVHHRHNGEHRHVLQTRSEGQNEEPWTWVRTHGQGRVFYTAYGHDARTWSNPGFQALVERGIRWAAGRGAVFDSTVRVPENLKPFEYVEAKVPNYVPSSRWGTQGEPIGRMQLPLEAAESMRHSAVPPGFEVQLFAAEPDIVKPIAMTWDHRGRLWIAETVDYPNELQPQGQGRDRIKICEDTDGDGRADKFSVFADKLSIPTSLICARGGLIVHQAPDTLFLQDTDGDDRADVRQVLFTGWSTADTHAGPSNLRWGLDNWLWGMVGYAGFKGQVGGEEHEFRTGFYRFKPDGSKLEFLRNTNNNSWGVGLSEEGLVFGSTANGNPSVYLPIPNRYYEQVRGWATGVLGNTALDDRFYAITDRVRQVDYHGRFTAAAGHALYTARSYPKRYWNRAAFVTEPTGHLAATFFLEPQGSDFVSYNAWNLLASEDQWAAPIAAEVGPDGQVWMIDWYNFIVQHNPTPEGFDTGKGNAYETPLRDKRHGRIYRIVYTAAEPAAPTRLDPADGAQLVAALEGDNMFWRLTAQHLLVERGQRNVVPKLVQLAEDQAVDEIGLNTAAIHALWTLHGLETLDGSRPDALAAALLALKHPSAGVRRNALAVLPRDKRLISEIRSTGVLNDPDPQVRLAALLTLSEMPASDDAAAAVALALGDPRNLNDRWIPDAATSAAAAHDLAFLRAVASQKTGASAGSDRLPEIVARVAEHYARGGPVDTVGPLLIALAQADARVAEAAIAGIAHGWPNDQPPDLDDQTEESLAGLLATLSPSARGQLVSLASRWGSKQFERYAAEIASLLLAKVQDDRAPDRTRIAAARELIDLRKGDADLAEQLLDLISPRTAPELAVGLLESLRRSQAPQTGAGLVERLAALTPEVRSTALQTLLARADWTGALLDGVEEGQVQLADLSVDQKQALAAHPNQSLADRARELLSQGGALADPDRQKVIDDLAPLVLRPADAAQGKLVFKQQCAKCHLHSGEGNKVGPDLTGVAVHPKSELLIHILDPSRSVEGNFRQYTVVTEDGLVLGGLLSSETRTSIELIDAEGKPHMLLRDEIDELVASRKSVMPEGFEKQVPPEAIADLLEFLTQRGKFVPLDLRKVATIVSTRGMFYSKEAQAERLIFDDWSPKTFEGVPFYLVDPRGDQVPNVVLLYGPQGTFPPQMPKSVSLPCNAPAKAVHLLSGVSGWGHPLGGSEPTTSLIVRLHYAGGAVEDHELKNGVHFADYIRHVDVPGSKLAFLLRSQQIRYLAIHPAQRGVIEHVELVKGPDDTAPIVMAVTVETP